MNGRYVILVEGVSADEGEEGDVLDLLETLAGTVDAPSDWAVEHDHYLYGTPKHHNETALISRVTAIPGYRFV